MERKRIKGLMMALAVMMMVVEVAESKLFKIGERGWIPNYNYTQWLNQQDDHFYVGDWLYFVFDKDYYNVLEVSETSYENCIEKGFIMNITRGGRDVYELKEARTYYFLSSGGYCWNGMKIAISVQQLSPAPSPSPPASNGSPTSSNLMLFIPFYVALFWAIF